MNLDEWRLIKQQLKQEYLNLPLKKTSIVSLISMLCIVGVISTIGLLIALICAGILKQHELIISTAIIFCLCLALTILVLGTIERKNLMTIALNLEKKIDWRAVHQLVDLKLLSKIMMLVFFFQFRKYIWTQIFSWLIWTLILVLIFIVGYYIHLA